MIKRGDIVFVMHHGSILSRTIAWFMHSDWSHSAIVCDVTDHDIYLHETSDTQTKVGMLSLYSSNKEDSIEIVRVPDVHHDDVNQSAKFHNSMYGYGRLLGAGMRRLMMRMGWNKCPMLWPWGGPLCMTIPHAALRVSNPSMPKLNTIDTQELYEWCMLNGKAVAFKNRGDNALSMA